MKNPRVLFADMPYAIKEITPTESFAMPPDELLKIRGMLIEFEHGRFLSIQASPSSYATHIDEAKLNSGIGWYDTEWNKEYLSRHENWYNIATSVEIATWDIFSEPRDIGFGSQSRLQEMPGGDTVMGYVTEEQLVAFVFDLLSADKIFGAPVSSPLEALGANWYDEFDV